MQSKQACLLASVELPGDNKELCSAKWQSGRVDEESHSSSACVLSPSWQYSSSCVPDALLITARPIFPDHACFNQLARTTTVVMVSRSRSRMLGLTDTLFSWLLGHVRVTPLALARSDSGLGNTERHYTVHELDDSVLIFSRTNPYWRKRGTWDLPPPE